MRNLTTSLVTGAAIACFIATARADLNVVSVSPAARSLAAPINSPIVITFDKPVKRTSIVPLQSFWAFGRWSGTLTGTFAFSNNDQTVTLNHSQALSAGEAVMVILSRDIEATDGEKLRTAGYSFQFWTRAAPASMVFSEIDRLTTRTVPNQSSRAYGGMATDLNHDHFPDISIVNEDTADVRVFMNKADRSAKVEPFTQPTFPVGDRASPSEPSDFNRDGHADFCVANIDANNVSILLGNGDGTFAPQQLVPVGMAPRGIAVLDADGDGDADIVNTNVGSNNLSIMLNNGAGIFGSASFFEGGANGEWALAAADMNNDGILDLVIGAQTAQRVLIRTGQGGGVFNLASSQLSDGLVWMLNTGDLNGDGNEDVAVGNSNSNRAAILFGNGAATLSAPVRYGTDPFTLATDVGDLDGDGDLDWIVSSYAGDWRVFTNDGAGVFTFDREFPSTTAASCALMTDLDRDFDLDLVLIDEEADEIIIMKNASTGTIPAASIWGVTVISLGMLVGATLVLLRWHPTPI